MEIRTPYAFGRTLDLPFADADAKVRAELAKEGFGVISEVDVKQKFAEKLKKDFRNYVILGACNPPLAYEVLSRELPVGTLLPCNVVLYSVDDASTSVVAMDPVPSLSMAEDPEVVAHAREVAEKMHRVIAAL